MHVTRGWFTHYHVLTSAPVDQRPTPRAARGLFVVSLDFELHWGVRDKRTVSAYRESLLGVRRAIPALLDLFKAQSIHATWASVGFLFFDGRDELMAALPDRRPNYRDVRYSPYEELQSLGRSESEDPFHFAPSLIRLIAATPGQEVGTHTFSHYYCLEPGHDQISFESDIGAAVRAAERFGIRVQSIVFPRNQVNRAYLPICQKFGINTFRGTQKSFAYQARSAARESPLDRAGRLLDSYLPLSGHNTYPLANLGESAPFDVRASSFLRPYSTKLAPLDSIRFRRIKNDLTHAARAGEAYHLWWHPHNFGLNLVENITFLQRILHHVGELRVKYGMQSVGMTEAAQLLASTQASSAS